MTKRIKKQNISRAWHIFHKISALGKRTPNDPDLILALSYVHKYVMRKESEL